MQGTVSAMSTVSSNFKSNLQMNHRGAQRLALSSHYTHASVTEVMKELVEMEMLRCTHKDITW